MTGKISTYRRGGFIIKKRRARVDIPDLGGPRRKRTIGDLPIGKALHLVAFMALAVSACFLVSYLFYLFMLVTVGIPFGKAARFPIAK